MGANAGTYAQVAGAAGKAYGAYSGSQATKSALEAQSTVAHQNAQIGEWQAQDALERGARMEQAVRTRGAQLKGTQRARFAANGVSMDSGSVLDVLTSNDYVTNVDAATAHDNAEREAWAFRTQATNSANRAGLLNNRADGINSGAAALSSLLTDGGTVAKSWYRSSQGITGSPKGGD